MDFRKLLTKIKSFNLPEGQYALFGSAPIVVRNIRPFSHDIDILVSQKVWEEYKNKPDWKYSTFERDERTVEILENGEIEFYNVWAPGEWDTEKLLKEANIIDGLSFVKLEEVLKWKKISARPKDLDDVKLIEDYLKKS